MFFSSSNWVPDAFIWQASRPTLTRHGSHSGPDSLYGGFMKMVPSSGFGFCFGTTIANIQKRLIMYSRLKNIRVILTPVQAPNANAYAERWVRTVREECLDHILIINEGHLQRVLNEYIAYYETARPDQGLEQQLLLPRQPPTTTGAIQRQEWLGGIINNYYRGPAPTAPYQS